MFRYLILGLIFGKSAHAIFENCDFYQEVEAGTTYHIFTPGYPNYYPPGTTCRWVAVSPPNTKISLNCQQFYLPASQNCALDKVGVSRNGRIDLADVEYFCGEGTLDIVTNENRLNVVLLSEYFGSGGSFLCELQVRQARQSPCACGYTNMKRIVGGYETGVNEYPMMAGLIDGRERELFCGATIISPKFALTAAHCLVQKRVNDLALLVGDHDISVGNETDSAKLYRLETFYIHPSYDTTNQKNDLALVKVRDPIQFSMKVGPACLPFLNRRDSFAGELVRALGWGSTDFTGPSSDKLLQVPLNVITNEQCKTTYRDMITERHICTFKDRKDACQSDSGGPLLWRDPVSNIVKIVGVISYGIHCGDKYPSVNTRVSSYLDWIVSTTGEQYCPV